MPSDYQPPPNARRRSGPPWSRRRRERRTSSRGCGYFAFVCISACTLLLLNGAVVGSLFAWYQPFQNLFDNDIRFKQATILIAPVALVLIEYWVFDFISDRLSTVHDEFDED